MLSLNPIINIKFHASSTSQMPDARFRALFLYPKSGQSTTEITGYANYEAMLSDFDEEDDSDLMEPAKKFFSVIPAPPYAWVAVYSSSADIEDILDEVYNAGTYGFYGVYLCSDTALTHKRVAAWLETEKFGMHFYGVTGTIAEATGVTGCCLSFLISTRPVPLALISMPEARNAQRL